MVNPDRVICLGKQKYGEADLILRFISSNGDVFSAIAKSALKSRRRFGGGVLEPTHHMSITLSRPFSQYAAGTNDRLPVLTEAQLIDDFSILKSDYDRLSLAIEFVRWVSIVSSEGDAHREVFNLLGHALKAAEQSSQLSLLKLHFQIKFLHLQGVLPLEERFVPFAKTPIRAHETLAEKWPQWRAILPDAQSLLESYMNK